MNIHRLPYSGRNNEYYSEDGFMSGVVAAATSRGAASKGLYTFIKHFAVNDQENHRGDRDGQFGLCTWANEQAIREIYLKPFEMCVENEPITLNYLEEDGNGGYQNATREMNPVNAVMTSFNRLGYTWTGGCYPLLTGVLREEWGFDGFVITDNANTGLFMDAYQMIEAGGDAKLTNEPASARWTFRSERQRPLPLRPSGPAQHPVYRGKLQGYERPDARSPLCGDHVHRPEDPGGRHRCLCGSDPGARMVLSSGAGQVAKSSPP